MTVARIGLLGGTFDPPHLAHIGLAHAARAALALHEVRMIPAPNPWQKADVSPVAHRVAMLRLAVADAPGIAIDPVELDRTGPSYTVDTLAALRAREGPHAVLVLLLGSDQWRNLPTWHRHDELLHHANIAVARRGDTRDDPATLPAPGTIDAPAGRCVSFAMPPLDVSASRIRAALRAGTDAGVATLVPPAVLAYIRAHRLYRPDGPHDFTEPENPSA